MIIKDKIQIGGSTWTIIIEDLDVAESRGICIFDKHEIRLHNNENKEVITETFWHEILHVVHRLAGYPGGSTMSHDHTLVDSETPILHQIMNQVIEWQKK